MRIGSHLWVLGFHTPILFESFAPSRYLARPPHRLLSQGYFPCHEGGKLFLIVGRHGLATRLPGNPSEQNRAASLYKVRGGPGGNLRVASSH